MDHARTIYAITFTIYLVFFLLFARFFVWKSYSDRKYWNKRPHLSPETLAGTAKRLGKDLPFISIMVPARNESLVIENTIEHLLSLEYPKDSFEVVVVTDEKETLTSVEERDIVTHAATGVLMGQGDMRDLQPSLVEMARSVIVSCLSEFALEEYLRKGGEKDELFGVPELCSLPETQRQSVVRDMASAIVGSQGAPRQKQLQAILKRTCPWLSEKDMGRVYPACLSVAVPVIAVYADLCEGFSPRLLRKTIRHVTLASHDLTTDIIGRMANFIAGKVMGCVQRAYFDGTLETTIRSTLRVMYPTTQEIVDGAMFGLPKTSPTLKHIVVPFDFDGKLGGERTGESVESTKGRALNWGLAFLDPRTQVCGFYDAESRPHKGVLLYVGYRRLMDPVGSRVLQGPVFQVRNFYHMTPFCRIASLYQAIAHDWYLPWLFQSLPFVGGTNVFVERQLMQEIGGWDCHVLTEDLEFGTRAYLMKDAWPEYLPYSSSEQTPPKFRAFFRQRLRWGTGHLQVVDKIGSWGQEPKIRKLRRKLIIKGQVEWVGYQLATFVPPVAMFLNHNNALDASVIPPMGRFLLGGFSAVYLGFTLYAFHRYSPHLDNSGRPESGVARFFIYLGLLILPLAAFVFPFPYTAALILKASGKEPKSWVKTPRTKESRQTAGKAAGPVRL